MKKLIVLAALALGCSTSFAAETESVLPEPGFYRNNYKPNGRGDCLVRLEYTTADRNDVMLTYVQDPTRGSFVCSPTQNYVSLKCGVSPGSFILGGEDVNYHAGQGQLHCIGKVTYKGLLGAFDKYGGYTAAYIGESFDFKRYGFKLDDYSSDFVYVQGLYY